MPNTKKIQLVSGLPKPDWSITDETNASYIKNKPTTLAGYGITDAAKDSDLSTHTSNTSNPHSVTKAQVGLDNVENKSSATIRGEITSGNVTTALGYTPLSSSLKGASSGIAELDENGKVPSSQLPSYVDDCVEGYLYNNKLYKESSHTTEISGESGKIYIDLSSNKTYRWSGSAFVEISASLALGETSSTAYRGDRGKTAYDHSQAAHAPSNAEKNIIVGVQKNGTDLTVDSNRKVNITVPTKTSELSNDSGFITTSDIPEGAAASATTPKMDGVATVGTETAFARGDHIHPSDTSKVDKVDGKGLSANDYTDNEKSKLAGIETGATKTTIDSALSSTSANPVQNKVVVSALDTKLDKSGGTMTGTLTIDSGTNITFSNSTGNGGAYICEESSSDDLPVLTLYGVNGDEAVAIDGVATPTSDGRAANKKYVDDTLASGNAGSATKLANTRYIDGVAFNGDANVTRYATCSTATSTAAKVASVTSGTFSLITGARVTVRFTYANTASSPTLNVGGTGAKSIYWHNVAIPSTQYWSAYSTLDFVYTGSVWELVGIAKDNNTTYPTATTSSSGLLPALSGSSSEYLRGDGQWATVSSSSGGMTREFYTGKISVTSYTTSTDKSKIYTVTVKDARSNCQTLIVDYKTVQFCKDSNSSFLQMFIVYTSSGLVPNFLKCTYISGGAIKFEVTNTDNKIIQICGFY